MPLTSEPSKSQSWGYGGRRGRYELADLFEADSVGCDIKVGRQRCSRPAAYRLTLSCEDHEAWSRLICDQHVFRALQTPLNMGRSDNQRICSQCAEPMTYRELTGI